MGFIGFLHLLCLGGCRGATPRVNCLLVVDMSVGTGLSYDTNEPVLKDVFGQHGEIIEVKVICDHKSGKSRGYGFVHFTSEDSASKALAEMDGQLLDGRNIRIQYANNK